MMADKTEEEVDLLIESLMFWLFTGSDDDKIVVNFHHRTVADPT